ncbi:cytochrome P450 [Amycolatopsis rhizosphaerae]|nr:cytochrome P450 [Amycolatopsis rhizosphaerae]
MTIAHEAPDILSPEFAENPYAAYRIMREQAPLLWHEPMQKYIISRYDDVVRACKDQTFTTDNYVWQLEPAHGGRTIVQMSGREHSVRRALVAPAFRGTELQQKFLPVIERNARDLIDRFREAGRADLVWDFARHFPINVIVDMLGLDKSDHARFQGWYTAVIEFLGNLSQDPEVNEAGVRAGEEMAAYMIPIIQQRRREPGDDLLSTLCAAEVEGTQMSDQDIKAFVSLLLAAGGETTDKAVASMFKNLLAHPDQLAAVREDRTLIDRAFAETLRYSPPVHMVMRELAEDVELSGGVVPAGSTVICLLAAANRDPDHFADPDSFDIFRDDLPTGTAFSAAAEHLSFSLGRHFCVGALLARTEVEVGTNLLLDAMPDLELDEGANPVEQGVFTRGPASLPVRFSAARMSG